MSTQSSTIVQRGWNCCNILREETIEDFANLPDPDILAAEIIEDLKSALEQFEGIAADLGEE